MSNMPYCRFQNTLRDLQDCRQHLEGNLSNDEAEARNALLNECINILQCIGVDLEVHNVEKQVDVFCADQQEIDEGD